VDHRQTDSGLPPAESQEALSESQQPGSMTSEATDTESTQALTTSSNGPSPRKIEANRKNAKKSTGPKTSVGKYELLEQYSARVLSKRLPQTGDHRKQEFDLYWPACSRIWNQ
jgi:hypothetical protein